MSERSREKYLTLTIGLPNVCGCVPALVKLWVLGQSFLNAQVVLSDPFGWAVAFGAAGLGWLVYMSTPSVMAVYCASAARVHENSLKRLQQTLIETWGEEVADEDGTAAGGTTVEPVENA